MAAFLMYMWLSQRIMTAMRVPVLPGKTVLHNADGLAQCSHMMG